MPKYSKEVEDNIIKQMLPPISKSASDIHKETGVSEQQMEKAIKSRWKSNPIWKIYI